MASERMFHGRRPRLGCCSSELCPSFGGENRCFFCDNKCAILILHHILKPDPTPYPAPCTTPCTTLDHTALDSRPHSTPALPGGGYRFPPPLALASHYSMLYYSILYLYIIVYHIILQHTPPLALASHVHELQALDLVLAVRGDLRGTRGKLIIMAVGEL